MLVRVSHPTRWILPVLLLSGLLLAAAIVPLHARAVRPNPPSVRFATFNASLNRGSAGLAQSDLSQPYDPNEANAAQELRRRQAANVAEVIQRVRPDVLLINEFDYAPATALLPASIDSFRANYLEISQNGAQPIDYPFAFTAESNTGIPSGFDLDNSGSVGGPNDAFGFGFFPGQFGMAVFSRYPINESEIRTFQHFLWKDMPGALLPHYPDPYPPNPDLAGDPWYSADELAVFRLSSKSHWDIPILVRGKIVHFLVSHPTPPVFDGLEDRNGTRNFDEIRFWADYITPGEAGYIYDDDGVEGGLAPGSAFVIAGDENSDPLDGDSIDGAIQQLIEHPLVNAGNMPDSLGGPQQSALQGGVNATHLSDPAFDTADFAEPPGNLHADYVLPRENLEILDSAVFWPLNDDPLFRLVGVFDFALIAIGGFPTSDHRLVWIDLRMPATSA
jgi:Endonuclease/Exonuclease/phosphatase family